MKKIIFCLIACSLLNINEIFSQNVAITDDDTYTANTTSMLDVKSTTKGLLIPRLSTAQRTAIVTPATSLLVFDTSLNGFYYYNGTTWINLSSGSSSGLLWSYSSANVYLTGSSDKVGIGTSTPLHKLHVSDNVTITDGTDGSYIDIQNPNATAGILSGIRFFNSSSSSRIKGGIFYKNMLSYGRGDLILANNSEAANTNVTSSDARLTIKNTGGVEVKATAQAAANASLFHVLNATGDTIFAVYDGGVRVNVYDDPTAKTSGSKGGFAVGGFSPAKGTFTNDYLRITPDSVRIYVEDNPASKAAGSKGGFAVGGFSPAKVGLTNEYLRVTSDTTRIYTMDTIAGFGIKNLEASSTGNYLRLSPKNYLIGHDAGKSLTTGKYNFIAGYQAAKYMNTGSYNTYIGYQSGYSDLKGLDNVFLGYQSGYSNVGGTTMGLGVGYQNTFLGNKAGFSNTQGINNTFVGNEAGFNNIGTFSIPYESYTGSWNVFVGDQAGYNNTSASYNLYAGMQAGYTSTTGGLNVFLGGSAGRDNTTGSWNVFIGTSSGRANGTGEENVYIGNRAGYSNAGGSNNIFIGNEAGSYAGGVTGKFILDNSNSGETSAYMYGDMSSYTNKFLRLNEKLGVNVTPTYQLHVIDNTTSSNNAAIYGIHDVTDGYGIGVEGHGGYKGVRGYVSTTYSSTIYGGEFRSYNYGAGNSYGLYSYAYATSGTAYAGYFSGNVNVTGTLSKGGGSFKIDHPLDPENKYLYHSFVESPDMKNIYDGVVVLDANGEATVTMPNWFDALNKDFRYQLTSIGGYAPIYIKQKVQNNKFIIAGGNAGMEVSWMVTGIRKDPFAEQNRIPVEVEKSQEEKGLYLYPEAYGKSHDKGIDNKNINNK